LDDPNMNNSNDKRHHDEQLLIDFLMDRLDAPQAAKVRRRLEDDPSFSNLHKDLQATFTVLSLSEDRPAPEGLAERTLLAVQSARQTDSLIAREEMATRRAYWPTFSMRELTALAASVLILASVFIPSLRMASRNGARYACLSNVGQLGTALQTYAAANNGQLPTAIGQQARRWLPAGNEPAVSNSTGLFRLVLSAHAAPSQFICPAVGGDSFAVTSSMVDFPASNYVQYSYQHAVGRQPIFVTDRDLADVRSSMAILADSNPLFANGRFLKHRMDSPLSDNHDGQGQNVLYLDMHAEWATNAAVGVRNDNIYLAEGVYQYDGDEAPVRKTDSFLLPASCAP
jgi:hypothetical protein